MRDYGKWVDPTSSTQKIIKNVIQKINTITSAKLAVTVDLLSLFSIYCSLGTALSLYVCICISVRLPFAWHTVFFLSLASYFTLSHSHSFVPWSPWSARGLARTCFFFLFRKKNGNWDFFCLQSKNRAQFGGGGVLVVVIVLVLVTFGLRVRSTQNQGGLFVFLFTRFRFCFRFSETLCSRVIFICLSVCVCLCWFVRVFLHWIFPLNGLFVFVVVVVVGKVICFLPFCFQFR